MCDFGNVLYSIHDDVIKWNHFPRYWPFVRRIHRSPVNSPHKDQWRGALILSLICAWTNGKINNPDADDLRCYGIHYDVNVMYYWRSSCGISTKISREHNFVGMTTVCLVWRICTALCFVINKLVFLDTCLVKVITLRTANILAPHTCHISEMQPDDVIKWKHFPRYWPLVRGNHRSAVNSPHRAIDTGLWCFHWSAPE